MKIRDIQIYFNLAGAGWGADWCAVQEGYDMDDPVGYGPTPQAALEDLMDSIESQNDRKKEE
jgi:hypothetical protein